MYSASQTRTTADDYVRYVVSRYKNPTGEGSPGYAAYLLVYPLIREWAGQHLLEMSYSGSYAKGTSIRGATDVDFFISLASSTPGTLKELYWSLYVFLQQKGLSPRAQNVSIGITLSGTKIDLVPGRKQANKTGDHSLYRRKADTWTQTNVAQHIAVVRGSQRVDDICAVKVWRQLHSLDFPSFYLELTVIAALYRKPLDAPAANFLTALGYIANNLSSARVIDPANSNNVISDDMTDSEKQAVIRQAKRTLEQAQWAQVIW